MKRLSERFVAGGFLLALLMLCGVGTESYANIRKLTESRKAVEHTHEVLGTLNKILSGVEATDRARRSYSFSRDKNDLASFQTGVQETNRSLATVRQLTSDNLEQQRRLDTLRALIENKLVLLKEIITLDQQAQPDPTRLNEPARIRVVKQTLSLQEDIQTQLKAMDAVERTLLQQRLGAIDTSVQRAVLVISLAYVLSLGLLVGVFGLLQHEIRTRKRAESALQKHSEETYDLYNKAPCGYHSLDATGTFIRINDTELSWLGYTRDEIIHKKTFAELTTAQSKLVFEETFPQFKAQGWMSDVEFELLRKDGTVLPVSLSATAIRDAAGNFVMSRSTLFDISDRKRAEAALQKANEQLEARVQQRTVELSQVNALLRSELLERKLTEQALAESEKQLRTITDALPVLISYVDAEQRYRFNNHAYEQWFGYSLEKIYGQPLQQVLGETAYQTIEPYVKAVLAGQEVTYEGFVPYKNGGMRWVSALYIPDRGEQGDVKGYFALISDITDRKQAEQALLESEKQLRLITDALPVLVSYVDADQHYRFNNQTYEQWYGHKRTEITGQTLRQVIGKLAYQHIQPYVEAALSGETVTYESVMPYKDGGTRWINATYIPDVGEQGTVQGFFALITDITDRKRAEEALRESKERLTFALQTAEMGDWDLNLSDRTAHRSLRHDQIFGYDCLQNEWTYEKLLTHILPEDRASVKAKFGVALLKGEVWDFECRIQRADGVIRWIWARGHLYQDTQGDTARMLGVIADITDRKQVEEALRQSEERLYWVLQNMPVMLDALDPDWNIIVWNRECERVTGYSADEIVGNASCMELLYPDSDYRQQMATTWAESGNNYRNWEWDIVCKDGSVRTVSWSNISDEFPIPGWATWGIGVDVTDRKLAEAALRESEQRLSLAIEGSGMATWDINLQTGEALWSAQHFKLLGYEPVLSGEATLSMWQRCVHPDDVEWVMQTAEQAIQTRSSYRSEHRIRRADNGQLVWLAAFGRVLSNEAGQAVRFIGIILDITDRKQAEEALRDVNEALEFKVQERTAALKQLNEDLVRSNQELEQFAYVASHDLQEPLRAVMGYTQLLIQDYQAHFDESAQQYADYIVDGAKRMQRLIQDLLLYSRVGTRDLVFAPVDCNIVLTQVLHQLQVAIADRHAVITYDPLPTVHADTTQLTQLLQNLLGNAIKFCRETQPQVHVSVTLKDNEWLFGVRDNGIGIKPRYLERIFEIFKRLHTRTEFPGTGIGLAICKKIVDRHNGRIWAESELGTGTTIYFTIPRSNAP